MNNDLIMEEPLYGEVSFDRVRMQHRIDELEDRVAQINRLHEGLVKDKEDSFKKAHHRLECDYRAAISYVEHLKNMWPEDQPWPTTDTMPRSVPDVMPGTEELGYLKDSAGVYHKITDPQPHVVSGYFAGVPIEDKMWPISASSTIGSYAADREEEEKQLILEDDEDD
jgi:hypothetical protein